MHAVERFICAVSRLAASIVIAKEYGQLHEHVLFIDAESTHDLQFTNLRVLIIVTS
jgi:hypothetical protein